MSSRAVSLAKSRRLIWLGQRVQADTLRIARLGRASVPGSFKPRHRVHILGLFRRDQHFGDLGV